MASKSQHDRVIRLYEEGKLTDSQLHNAVGYGWITEEEYEELISKKAES